MQGICQKPVTQIFVVLTDCCNYSCPHCIFGCHPKKHSFLKLIPLFKWLINAVHLGVRLIDFSGGEPFTHSQFSKMLIRFLSNTNNITVSVASNLSYIDQLPASVLRQNAHRLRFRVAVEGPNAAIHDEVRMPGSFEKMTHFLSYLKNNNIEIVANTILRPNNIETLPSLSEFLANFNVKRQNWICLLPFGRAKKFNWHLPTSLWFSQLRDQARALSQQHSSNILLSGPILRKEELSLATDNQVWDQDYNSQAIVIFPNGNIYEDCFIDAFIRKNRIGSIYTQSFQDIRFKAIEQKSKYPCDKCMYRFACRGLRR